MKTCVICNAEILDPLRKKTCSPECGDRLAQRRAKAEGERVRLSKPDSYIPCRCCGKVFLKKFRQVFCSDACRVKVSHDNMAKQYIKTKAKAIRKVEKAYSYFEREAMRSGYF